MASLRMAAQDAVDSFPDARIMVFSDYDFAYELVGKFDIPEWDGHAGTIETARIMALRPELVGETLPPPHRTEFTRFMVEGNVKEKIPEGYWGDPQRATADMGGEVNRMLKEKIVSEIRDAFGL